MLENLLGVFLICSTLFRSNLLNTLLDCAAQARADKNFIDRSESSPIHLDKLSHIREI